MVTKNNPQRGIIIQNVVDAQKRLGVPETSPQIINCYLRTTLAPVQFVFPNRDVMRQYLQTGAADDYNWDN